MNKINIDLKLPIHKAGLKVIKLLKAAGFEAFWVGGVVRNIILKQGSDNIDIATSATPDQIEAVLKKANIHSKPVGKKFGTIFAVVNGFVVEVTTFRAEGWYSDKRHPDQVQFIKDYLEDARRRDFTINALYLDPLTKQIYDPTAGIKDLGLRLIRFVDDSRKRIDEDPLRMIRAVRFAATLNFKLEKNTFAAIKTRAKLIQFVSGERVKAELDKIMLSKVPSEGIKLLDKTGLAMFILPELVKAKQIFHGSKLYHLEGSVFDHTMLVLRKIENKNLNLPYSVLFHDLGKLIKPVMVFKDGVHRLSFRGHEKMSQEIFLKFANKYRFPRKSRNAILWLIKTHDSWKDFEKMKPATKIKLASNENFGLLLDLVKADHDGNIRSQLNTAVAKRQMHLVKEGKILQQKINKANSLMKRLVNGSQIMKSLKLKPGPKVGRILNDIKTKVIIGKIKSKKDLNSYWRVRRDLNPRSSP